MTHPPSRPAEAASPASVNGLGTFGGVFTPSILTILGVIMYLRFGWVLGNVGLAGTLLIVTLSTGITFLTALSISAIATAQHVKIGGAYYMISRSLGIETGGAIGIPLYFAQALSVALYVVGFAESVVAAFPQFDERVVGMVTLCGVALLALKSAETAIKAQYFIMAAIGLSLLSLLFGQSVPPPTATPPEIEPAGFWVVFAVFFPAVTGIMAGVNLSGDLKDPAKSIPWGTLAAVGVGYLIYMGLPVLLALRATPEQLIADPLIMRRMAIWGDAILLGVWGATLSSAVGSILGAPRVLQALARDGILPPSMEWLGTGSGPNDEPRNGTAITFGVAFITVILGDLNLIAPVLTMFFLTTYAVLNITAGLEKVLGNPSFRPKFRVPWFWSLLGAIGCTAVMFLINTWATVAAICIVLGIYIWLQRRELESEWGDVRTGLWMALVRAGLVRLRAEPDPKNWRPHLLVLSGDPTQRWHLIELAYAFTQDRALLTVSTVAPEATSSPQTRTEREAAIRAYLEDRGIISMVRVIAAPTPFIGTERLLEAYGLGVLVPNTIVMGASVQAHYRSAYCDLIASIHRAQRNAAVLHYNPKRGFGNRARIDIWWGGLHQNGALMMILALLLQRSRSWRYVTVHVKMVIPSAEDQAQAQYNLTRLLSRIRMEVVPEIVPSEGRSFDTILQAASADADLVFLGMADPTDASFEAYYARLQQRIEGLPTTMLVLAGEDLAFRDILLDEAVPDDNLTPDT